MSYTITLPQWDNLTGVCLRGKGLVADYPAGRNDGFIYVKGAEGGKENFHVHSFETVKGDNMVFTTLLPKSGSFRPPRWQRRPRCLAAGSMGGGSRGHGLADPTSCLRPAGLPRGLQRHLPTLTAGEPRRPGSRRLVLAPAKAAPRAPAVGCAHNAK